jgi:hypothetical protein
MHTNPIQQGLTHYTPLLRPLKFLGAIPSMLSANNDPMPDKHNVQAGRPGLSLLILAQQLEEARVFQRTRAKTIKCQNS